MNIGVFVGSFNPPHAGHLAFVRDAKDKYSLDVVYVIAEQLCKYKTLVSYTHRQRMLELLFQGDSRICTRIDGLECDTMRHAELWDIHRFCVERYPHGRVYLMVGISTFQWYQRQIRARALNPARLIIVNLRSAQCDVCASDIAGCSVYVVASDYQCASSTEVRGHISDGTWSELLSVEVSRYIRVHGLYTRGDEADYRLH